MTKRKRVEVWGIWSERYGWVFATDKKQADPFIKVGRDVRHLVERTPAEARELRALRAENKRLRAELDALSLVANRIVLTVPQRDNPHHCELVRATGSALGALARLKKGSGRK